MRATPLFLSVFGLVISITANAAGGLSESGSYMTCDLAVKTAPSAQMKKAPGLHTFNTVCKGQQENFEVGLVNVAFKIDANEVQRIDTRFNITCTGNDPVDAYVFGGFPIGYQTRYEPWFYNPEKGRCFLTGNPALLKSIVATKNASLLVILPLSVESQSISQ